MKKTVHVVGAGLAGCECAWRLAQEGIEVVLYEMRPLKSTPAHTGGGLAELVCSNSLRSDEPATGPGLLKAELAGLDSLIMQAAHETRVPAGKALAVNRKLFSEFIGGKIENHPRIRLVRAEIESLDDPRLLEEGGSGGNDAGSALPCSDGGDPAGCAEAALPAGGADLTSGACESGAMRGAPGRPPLVLACGPLASEGLSRELARTLGEEHLYFYDAIAPVIAADSVNMERAFWGARYAPEDRDYLNCPFTEEEYHRFCQALLAGEKTPSRDFEREIHFEGCMPVEAMAERGPMTLAFGPFKPVGFTDPRTGRRPFALLQLRAEDLNKTMFNLVGCQTKLTYPEQARIFRMAPGLENAEFVRFGSMHRNTYVNAPRALAPDLSLRARPGVYLAGQITGVEGYIESAACGLWVGMQLAARLRGRPLADPPPETALGALLAHLRTPTENFQPSNIHFGLMPELGRKMRKAERRQAYAERARDAFAAWLAGLEKI